MASLPWIALSLVRLGFDTRASRLVQTLVDRGMRDPVGLLPALIEQLGIEPAWRRAEAEGAQARAVEALRQAEGLRIGCLGRLDAGYPDLLARIADPPVVLWHQGEVGRLAAPAVAVVGSRDASPAGIAAARRLGGDLARAGLTIVSGLARGVDGAAHEGALDAGGATIAVLGCGADVVYPAEHRALADRIRSRGLIASEYPPGTPPLPHHFPLRNRIISGLSKAVVVIEASDRSGSLITARAALDQGRDVLAVPGGIASGRHRGCHALIKDGARLVETVDDVLEEVGWTARNQSVPVEADNASGISQLQASLGAGAPATVDDLVARTGLPVAQILAELATLELSGVVDRLPGGYFVRVDGPAMDR